MATWMTLEIVIGELREDVGKLGLEAARIDLERVNFLEIWWPMGNHHFVNWAFKKNPFGE